MIKQGVDLRGVQPQLILAFVVACAVYARHKSECWITSASDGTHGPTSLHYQGLALDLRTRHVPPDALAPLHADLASALGEQFDVVLESDHLHVEFDPKDPEKGES